MGWLIAVALLIPLSLLRWLGCWLTRINEPITVSFSKTYEALFGCETRQDCRDFIMQDLKDIADRKEP